MNLRSTLFRTVICSLAAGMFPLGAFGQEPKAAPPANVTERSDMATPIRVILPALWEEKAPASKPEPAPVDERRLNAPERP